MIFDVHVHLPSPGWPGHQSFFRTAGAAVAYLKRAGVNRAIFNTWQGVFAKSAADLDQANRAALRLAARHSGTLYPGAVIHPDFAGVSVAWLEKFHRHGLRWVGELVPRCNMQRPYSDAAFLRLAEKCAEYGQILHLHYHSDVLELARQLPDCRLVVAHIPDQPALNAMADCPNLWLDIAGMHGGLCLGALERAVKTMGIDRLLFGTDFDAYEPRAFITRVRAVLPAQRDRAKVFWANAQRLIGDN
ncbi:MAG: amidohydrolase family protein [Kiritimatiellia bacterium]|jgi:predicted TIM-barrel fold metal-dependent hydrolase